MKRIGLILSAFAAVAGIGNCEPSTKKPVADDQESQAQPKSGARRLIEVQLPPLTCKGLALVDALHQVNKQLAEAAAGVARPEIVVVRHDYPKADNGKRILNFNLPASSLGERLNTLGAATFTHWKFSDGEQFIVFLTWHRPQYDEDEAGGGLFGSDNEGEQAGAGQPATRSESDSEGGDKPQPESEGRSR